jgi:hypothetical protein
MNTYPPEYLLHPVPVLAIYGLGTSKESDGSNPIDSSQPPVNKSNALASTLLNILLARQDFSLYDASRYMTNAVIPPPFRVMTVPKVSGVWV